VIHFKTLPYAKSYIAFTAVYCSSFLHSFPGLALAFLYALAQHELWDFPSSLARVAGILYTEWSPSTNLPAGLLVWPCTWMSVPALSSNTSATFSWKISRNIFSWMFCYARCVHWPLPGRIDEREDSSTILSFSQMKNRPASGLISPHQFYTCSPTRQLVLFYDVPPLTMVPQQVRLHGQWLGKWHHGVLPLDGFLFICCVAYRLVSFFYKFEHFWAEEYLKNIPGRTVLSCMEIFIYPWYSGEGRFLNRLSLFFPS
jgi:hypothetical protein